MDPERLEARLSTMYKGDCYDHGENSFVGR